MSAKGQSRRFAPPLTTSGPPLEADIVRAGWYVAKGANFGLRVLALVGKCLSPPT